jgi:DNA-3-methyladenine glycosylase II
MWFTDPARQPDWAPAVAALRRADPALRPIVDAVGPCTLHPRRDHFVVLCKAIFSQQISVAGAATLFSRFRDQFPQRRPTPQRTIDFLTSADPALVRHCGLSRQKQAYVLDLARHFRDRTVTTSKFSRLDDEQVIEALTGVRGIGRWTAEMFLIFVLNRTDVLPVDDLGLRKGVQRAYGLATLPTVAELRARGEAWRPYRSVATWYLWRCLSTVARTAHETEPGRVGGGRP